MRFKIHIDVLASLVRRVSGAIAKKGDQRYGRVSIDCVGGNLLISAGEADYYTVIRTAKVESITEGKAIVPADKFFSVVASGLKGTIEAGADKGSLVLQSGRSRFRIPVLGNLAIVAPDAIALTCYANCKSFISRLRLCSKIVNNDYYPFAHVAGGTILATDNLKAMSISFDGEVPSPLFFSKRGVGEACVALKGVSEDEYIWFGSDEAWTYVAVEDQSIWIRRMNTSFPDLSALFVEDFSTEIVTDFVDLKAVIKRVASVVGDEAVLKVATLGGLLRFSVTDTDGAFAGDAIEVKAEGEDVEFRVLLSEFVYCVSVVEQESVRVCVGERHVKFIADYGTVIVSRVV